MGKKRREESGKERRGKSEGGEGKEGNNSKKEVDEKQDE